MEAAKPSPEPRLTLEDRDLGPKPLIHSHEPQKRSID